MPNILRNVIAVLAGIVAGSVMNMSIILGGPALIPPPAGVDVSNAASIGAAIHLFQPRHFVMPFFAHALGTLVGATIAASIAATHRTAIAYAIGGVFLLGGIAASFMIPAPLWFKVLDLVVAYIPMAWAGLAISTRLRPGNAAA